MTLTTRPPIVDQILLPGQAAAPEGAIDGGGMYLMHYAFRRDLATFTAAVARTPLIDRAIWQALQRRWALFATVLHHHHVAEDTGLWPMLEGRARAAADDEGLRTLAAMEAEHAQIDPTLTAIATAFARLAEQGDRKVRDGLARSMATARDSLGAHLAHEEREAMAMVQRYLTPEDWTRFEKEHVEPSYGKRNIPSLVSWVLHDQPAEGIAKLRESAPALLVAWRLFFKPSFERGERRAFRYA